MLKISKIRKSIADAAIEYHVKQVLLFGSYANGNQTEKSDVDILVEFLKPSVSLLTIASLKNRLEDELNVTVDLIHGPLSEDAMIQPGKVLKLYGQ
jgi:predicted nucleotidyltransferase